MPKTDWSYETEKRLQDISSGSLYIENMGQQKLMEAASSSRLETDSGGKGKMEIFSVFPGIELTFNYFYAGQFRLNHASLNSVLEISHCRRGRIGWNMKNGHSIYLGPGDLALQTMDCCAFSEMNLPLHYYEGITISVDLIKLNETLPESLKEAEQLIRQFSDRMKLESGPFVLSSSAQTDAVLLACYDLPAEIRLSYYQLKIQELLLLLCTSQLQKDSGSSQYLSQQVDIIKMIHEQLILHLDQRYTIEELSRQYLINTSSLKSIFKTVYGLPIATYMKDYRIRQAARLLTDTNDSIACIAGAVGYENQSKFSRAFQDTFQILPGEYRRIAKLNNP